MYAHAEEQCPEECCGLVLDSGLRRSRNVMGELHAGDPEAFPRTAQSGFFLAPEDQIFLALSARSGPPTRVVYHSHVDKGAYFSESDRRGATLHGEPLYPELVHVVVGTRAGRATGAAAFAWFDGAFEEIARFER